MGEAWCHLWAVGTEFINLIYINVNFKVFSAMLPNQLCFSFFSLMMEVNNQFTWICVLHVPARRLTRQIWAPLVTPLTFATISCSWKLLGRKLALSLWVGKMLHVKPEFHNITNTMEPVVQLLNNFPVFYGTRRLITAFTSALHWSLSSASQHTSRIAGFE
jgi:hypothetical protein